jgi:hypothetical protein
MMAGAAAEAEEQKETGQRKHREHSGAQKIGARTGVLNFLRLHGKSSSKAAF